MADKNVEVSSGPRGQSVRRSFGRDDSSFTSGISDAKSKNGECGGSATNLAHSLTGASAVQHVKGESTGFDK